MADTVDLQQRLCLRVLCLGQLPNLSIVVLDLDRHLCDLFEHRTERLRETRRHHCQTALYVYQPIIEMAIIPRFTLLRMIVAI